MTAEQLPSPPPGGGDDGGHDPVAEGLALIARGAALVSSARSWSASDAALRGAVADMHRARAGVEAAWLSLVRALDARDGAVPGASGGRVAATFLMHALRQSHAQAAAEVRTAHALDPDNGVLPAMGAALAAGEVHRGHVDATTRVLTRLPDRLLRRVDAQTGQTNAAWIDGFLTEQSRQSSPRTTDVLARQLLHMLAPDAADRYDPDSYRRRTLTTVVDATGMTVLRGQLDPASGAVVRAALDHFSRPAASGTAVDGEGQAMLVPDERTSGQRRHDALVAIASRALKGDGAGVAGGLPAHVAIDATPEQVAAARAAVPRQRAAASDQAGADAPGCDESDSVQSDSVQSDSVQSDSVQSDSVQSDSVQSDSVQSDSDEPAPPAAVAGAALVEGLGPVSPGTFGRLLCEAILTTVLRAPNGEVLRLGRSVRTATVAQRRAVRLRDGGCAIPGCSAPPSACEVHHVVWWRHGGGTDVGNLALACQRHHTAVHAGIWVLVMRDGVPWAIPPPWVDPARRALRNTTHAAAATLRRRAQQMLLDLDPPSVA